MVRLGRVGIGRTASQITLDIQNKLLLSISTPSGTGNLYSISSFGNDYIVVGEGGVILKYDADTDTFISHSQSKSITTNDLRYIDFASGVGLAVGENFTILHYDPSTDNFSATSINEAYPGITLYSTFEPYTIYGVYYDIFVGHDTSNDHGVIFIWDGSTLQKVFDTPKGPIKGSLYTDDWKNYVTVGFGGGIYKSGDRGQTWKAVKLDINDNFYDLGGTSRDKLWIVSESGKIYLYNDYTETIKLMQVFGNVIGRIWVINDNDAYAVGGYGTLVHYDGQKWSKLPTGTLIALEYIYGLEDNKFFIAGTSGYMFKFYQKAFPSLIIDNLGNVIGSKANPLHTRISGETINVSPYSTIKVAETKSITSASGGIELSSGEITTMKIKSLPTNSGDMYIGSAPYSGYGYILSPGDQEQFNIDNLNKVKVFATVSGDKVTYYGLE